MRIVSHPACADIELTAVFHALSDPVRLAIVCDLATAGNELSCGALPVRLSRSTLSHHLKVLREAGLTVTRVSGTRRMVSLRAADLEVRFPGLLNQVLAAAGRDTVTQS